MWNYHGVSVCCYVENQKKTASTFNRIFSKLFFSFDDAVHWFGRTSRNRTSMSAGILCRKSKSIARPRIIRPKFFIAKSICFSLNLEKKSIFIPCHSVPTKFSRKIEHALLRSSFVFECNDEFMNRVRYFPLIT